MIVVENINFSYGKKEILKDISFSLNGGEILAICGNNGCGKSTLIKCLNKILLPKSGKVIMENKNLLLMKRRDIAKKIGYVAQKAEVSKITVYDSILLGRKPYIKFDVTKSDYEKVNNIIEKMELSSYALSYIDELSGGQLQKVMLARALVQEAKCLLLDEPTSNLDPHNQHTFMKLIKDVARENKIGILIVIHDLNLAIRYCDKFLFIKDKSVASCGDIQIMTENLIKDIYNLEVDIIEHNKIKVIIPR